MLDTLVIPGPIVQEWNVQLKSTEDVAPRSHRCFCEILRHMKRQMTYNGISGPDPTHPLAPIHKD